MKMASSGMTRKDMAQMFKKIGWKRKEESAPPPQPSSQPAVSVARRGVLKLWRIVFRGPVVARECLEDVLNMPTVIRCELLLYMYTLHFAARLLVHVNVQIRYTVDLVLVCIDSKSLN